MEKSFLQKLDLALVVFTLLLTVIGLLNLFSATYGLPVARHFNNQLIWVSLGIVVAMGISLINYTFYERSCWIFYIIVLIMLIVVLEVSAPVAGSVRWFRLGGISVQPSELMKPIVILTLANLFNRRGDRPPYHFHQLIFPFIVLLVPMYFIHQQPDLGTTLLLGITGFSMMLFVGIERKSLLTIGVAGLLLIPIAWFFFLSNYQKERVITFIEPEKYSQEGGYQITQAKIAVGSGMLTGKGYLKGTQSKLMFLPKQYTDFIFSNYAEEWGFLGCLTLMFLYLMFLLSGLNISLRAKDRYGCLIAFGFTAYFFWHILINICMELGMLPVVGIPLPFLSYGGSMTLTCFVGVGVMLGVNVRRYIF